MSRESIGEFEQLVLLALLRLGPDAYGVTVLEEIRKRTGRAVLRPAVYVALRRLEDKGLVRSREEIGGEARGGRALKRFEVRPEGVAAVQDSRRALLNMWDGLQAVLDER